MLKLNKKRLAVYKVSIIIPVYNVEEYLERCLNSVFKQTLKDIEIICVNDGSSDKSREILAKYEEISNFKVIDQINSGLSVARNTGLLAAKGEYVGFLDSDDFIDSEFYEKLYTTAVDYNADIACGNIIRENNKKKSVLINYNDIKFSYDIKEKFKLANSPAYNFVWNKIYKKNLLINNNLLFVPGMIYEDMCFTPDVLEKSNILVVVPDVFYHYWKNKNSLIQKDSDKTRADKLYGHKYLLEKCEKYNVKFPEKNTLISKKDFLFLGINFLRIYNYRATKKYYLFGIIKFLEIREKI